MSLILKIPPVKVNIPHSPKMQDNLPFLCAKTNWVLTLSMLTGPAWHSWLQEDFYNLLSELEGKCHLKKQRDHILFKDLPTVPVVSWLLPALAATSPNSCTHVSGYAGTEVSSMIQEVTACT